MATNANLPRPGTPERDEWEAEVVAAYKRSPCSLSTFARRFNVSEATMKRLMEKHEVDLRARNRARFQFGRTW